MTYYISHVDLVDLHIDLTRYSGRLADDLNALSAAVNMLQDDTSIAGQFAEGAKSYFREVHGTFICGLQNLLLAMNDRYSAYFDEHFAFDGDEAAQYDSLMFEDVEKRWAAARPGFEEAHDEFKAILASMADLVEGGTPGIGQDLQLMEQTVRKIGEYDERVAAIERRGEDECSHNFTALNALLSMIEAVSDPNTNINVGSYAPGLISSAPWAGAVFRTIEESRTAHEELGAAAKQTRKDVVRFYESIKAEERAEAGFVGVAKLIVSLLVTMVAGSVIGMTGGASTPFVISAIGTVLTAADGLESGLDLYYGATGDATSTSVGVVKDTLFLGNEEAYETFEALYDVGGSAMTGDYFGAVKGAVDANIEGPSSSYDEAAAASVIDQFVEGRKSLNGDYGERWYEEVMARAPEGYGSADLDASLSWGEAMKSKWDAPEVDEPSADEAIRPDFGNRQIGQPFSRAWW